MTVDEKILVYDEGVYAFAGAGGTLRWTAFVKFDDALEEIDVNARNRTEARAIARAALGRDYIPGGRIVRLEERYGWYL